MISFSRHKLDNGLTLLYHHDPLTPFVAINILYNVGSRDEDPERTGFAHLFEHLMFGGSINIPSYDEPLQRAGGENNAFTNTDITNYYLTLPAQNAEIGFWLESDRMLSLAFSPESLEVQRNVVMEEFKQRYLNQPYGDAWLKLRPLAYLQHPYQWATIGKELRHIEEASLDDVKNFFFKHYAPNNAILCVAGAISEEKALELTQKWFGPIPARDVPARNLPQEPKQSSQRRASIKGDVPADALYMSWHAPARADQLYPAYDLLSDILSRGSSARLFQHLVKEKAIFSELNAYLTGELDPGMLVIEGKINPGKTIQEAESAIWEELRQLQQNPVSEEELTKVKNKAASTFVFGETEVLNKAMNLCFYELLGDAGLVNQEMDKYNAVSSASIQEIAGRLFLPETCSILIYEKNA